MSDHGQDYDLRWVTRAGISTEQLCEFDATRMAYRVIGSGITFNITQMRSERKATIECPCSGCSHRRGQALRLRIAADAVRSNPTASIVADGVQVTNAASAKATDAAATQLLDNLVGHLQFVTADVAHAMTYFKLPTTTTEGPKQ